MRLADVIQCTECSTGREKLYSRETHAQRVKADDSGNIAATGRYGHQELYLGIPNHSETSWELPEPSEVIFSRLRPGKQARPASLPARACFENYLIETAHMSADHATRNVLSDDRIAALGGCFHLR